MWKNRILYGISNGLEFFSNFEANGYSNSLFSLKMVYTEVVHPYM